ncbi:hypothetical protein EH222_05610 [candidate division KSB1 bacterium]|nr:MAG: hypothetical protein EH222_05610 [candidate division KSB1 bacterium]
MSTQENKMLALLLALSLLLSATAIAQGNAGAIWTTRGDCGDETQDANHYAVGETIFINGSGFDPNTDHEWSIEGQPGQASCGPGDVVAQGGITTDDAGAFCFSAYTVLNDDCGEYKVSVGNKHDNYRVDPYPSIDIEKTTNGDDADEPTGPKIVAGEPVLWHYIVTNTAMCRWRMSWSRTANSARFAPLRFCKLVNPWNVRPKARRNLVSTRTSAPRPLGTKM